MGAAVYLGDELGAAGWRLAGLDVRVPAAGEATAALAWAIGQAPLVLVSATVAAQVEDQAMRRAACALQPLVLVALEPTW